MKSFAAGLALTCALTACESTGLSGIGTTPTGGGLALVAGTWSFSHFGAPTVRNEDFPNPGKDLRQHLAGMTMVIEEDGTTSSVAPGHAATYQLVVLEETPLYVKVGAPEQPVEDALVYEKPKGVLMMPSKLTIDGEQGVLPTYLKRK